MLLRRDLFRIFAFSLYLVAAGSPLFSQAVSVAPLQQDLIRTVKLPIDEWLDQGERMEIPWKVSLSRPLLTYQLRNLVRVTAEVPADLLQKQSISHDLHFIVKAAPERGKWEPEESYSHFRVEAKLDSRSELQMLAELYLQPGIYTVATIVYDGASGKRNLFFTRVQVGAPAGEALPQLLGSLPKIQFLPPPDNAAPLAAGRVLLPIATRRPVQLDLIVDLSTPQETSDVRPVVFPPYPPYPFDPEWGPLPTRRSKTEATGAEVTRETYEQSRLLQIASVLSAVDLKQGCIEVAAFDILRRRTILPFTPAMEVKWGKIRDEILSPDHAMVSVADLKGRRDAGKFFQQELEQTMTQPAPCKLNSRNSLQVIAILTRGVRFPPGSDKPQIEPGCNCKVFYLQETDGSANGGGDLKNMLKPLSPMTLQFGDPQDFRQKLLEFTQAMEKLP